MQKILLVDDSRSILLALELAIKDLLKDVEVLCAASFAEASDLMRRNQGEISVAVVDLTLPDCKDGQAASLAKSHKIPTIVLSGNDDPETKSLLLKQDVLDYAIKKSKNSVLYVASFVKRIIRNSMVTALVVDDSKLYRTILRNDLEKLRINVLEANDGKEALSLIESSENDISLVLTDYNMPNMDGIKLASALREKHDKDSLSIIALSASEDEHVLSDFIREGANDFLTKPHKFEELNVRINSNLDTLDLFQKTKDLANRDFMTGSYNRRYFFEAGSPIVAKNFRKDSNVAMATLDIDNFKNVNDTHGHDVGDVAIQEIATILERSLRGSDLIARFGGEEYCILIEEISLEDVQKVFEEIRSNFENNEIKIGDLTLKYTVSLGVFYGKSEDIDEMIKVSDNALYEAKESGRNRVVIHQL